ncbi:MAG: hypothetical protein PWR15_735 [Bacteroidota bacterium]|jgi:hypothetical protein|nr:hypothetical protein [Bacteroidota bacterium]
MVYWFTDEIRIRLFPAGVSFSTRVVCVQTDACAGKKENSTSRLYVFVANKCSALQAGFRQGFMPQNKFCGYENSAFQAKKHP